MQVGAKTQGCLLLVLVVEDGSCARSSLAGMDAAKLAKDGRRFGLRPMALSRGITGAAVPGEAAALGDTRSLPAPGCRTSRVCYFVDAGVSLGAKGAADSS